MESNNEVNLLESHRIGAALSNSPNQDKRLGIGAALNKCPNQNEDKK
jgi:hypothetical protein